jgi:predicted phosphoribosyltransferase
METLLAILLYLHVISPNSTYYRSQIDNDRMIYQQQINEVQNNQKMLNEATQQYETVVKTIIVVDDGAYL